VASEMGPGRGGQHVMRNPLVLGVLVVLILVGAGCNPFLDRLAHSSGECTMLNGPEHPCGVHGPSSK